MKGSSLKRRFDTRDERVRILLICEGKKTEPNYFDELREEYSHPWIKRMSGMFFDFKRCGNLVP